MIQQGSDKLSQPLYNDCVNMTCSDDDKNILEIHAHNSNNCCCSRYSLSTSLLLLLSVNVCLVFNNINILNYIKSVFRLV